MSTSVVANILDPVHDTLSKDVWDAPEATHPKLKPQHSKWIQRTILKVLVDAGYTHVEHWLSLVLTGSLTTYQYSEQADCDVSLFVNTEVFPEWSRAEMIGLMVEKMDGTLLPGTQYPMQCFVVPPSVKREDLYKPGLRSGYDIQADKWIVPPERSRTHNVEQEMNASYVYALECADKMERLLRYEPDKAIIFWHQIHHRRQRDQRAGKGDYSQANIVYKFLAKRGLFPEISQASGEYIAKQAAPFQRQNYPDLTCPHCHAQGTMKFDQLERVLHCQACGNLTQIGADYDLPQWADVVDYRSPEGVGEGWDESGESVIAPGHLPALGPRRQGAGMLPHPEAIEQARQNLGLRLPVRFLPVFKEGVRGGYAGVRRDPSTGGQAHVVYIAPGQAGARNWAAWHELGHAQRHEQTGEFTPTAQLSAEEYGSSPSEAHAEQVANQHADFDLWSAPHLAARFEVAKYVYDPMSNKGVVGEMGPPEGARPSHAQLLEHLRKHHADVDAKNTYFGQVRHNGWAEHLVRPTLHGYGRDHNPYEADYRTEQFVQRAVPGAKFSNPSELLDPKWAESGDPDILYIGREPSVSHEPNESPSAEGPWNF